jgi:hypothetical protein
MINIFNRLIFDVKYFNSWKKDDFFWFPVSALRFQVSSLANATISSAALDSRRWSLDLLLASAAPQIP